MPNRKRTLRLSLFAIAALTGLFCGDCQPARAQNQPAGLMQLGSTSLPAGQYMMTNINTGQSYYIFINQQGQLMAQDPRALQFNVQPLNLNANTTPVSAPAGSTAAGAATTGGGGFSGLLKQGLDSFLQNRINQGSTAGAPSGQ